MHNLNDSMLDFGVVNIKWGGDLARRYFTALGDT